MQFKNDVLNYTIQIKTGFNLPFFGQVTPQIDMTYDLKTKSKSVRINLTDTNAMKYYITDTDYIFGIKYGVEAMDRTAYCSLKKQENGEVEGHIYEYISLKDKDAVKSCADFYLGKEYSSVVGNKASGIIGMNGYINELYKTGEGKLLAYKVQETKTIFGITGTYHTLWFNLNSISGINTIKVTDHTDDNTNTLNANNVYVNSDKLFEPTYNTKVMVKTSRKYDIEMRNQYFYSYEDNVLKENKVSLPMMFIQDNHDNYTNYDDFPADMKSKNKIVAKVILPDEQLKKVRSDYDILIPLFKENKEKQTSETIQSWIGDVLK